MGADEHQTRGVREKDGFHSASMHGPPDTPAGHCEIEISSLLYSLPAGARIPGTYVPWTGPGDRISRSDVLLPCASRPSPPQDKSFGTGGLGWCRRHVTTWRVRKRTKSCVEAERKTTTTATATMRSVTFGAQEWKNEWHEAINGRMNEWPNA